MYFHRIFLWQTPFTSNVIFMVLCNTDYPHHIFLFSLTSLIFHNSYYNLILYYIFVYLRISLSLHYNMSSLRARTVCLVYHSVPRRDMEQRNVYHLKSFTNCSTCSWWSYSYEYILTYKTFDKEYLLNQTLARLLWVLLSTKPQFWSIKTLE